VVEAFLARRRPLRAGERVEGDGEYLRLDNDWLDERRYCPHDIILRVIMGLAFAEALMDLLPLVQLLQTGVESIAFKCGPRLHLVLQTAPQKLQAFLLVVTLPARVSGHSRLLAWLAARSSRCRIDATHQGTWLMI